MARTQRQAVSGPWTETTDEDLVAAAKSGDQDALRELLVRYRRFARAKARSYFLIGAEREDIVQEGMIGLYKAVRDYDPSRGASFRSFAELCITRQVLTAIKTASRPKHQPLNSYLSLDRPTEEGEPGRTIAEAVAVAEDSDPLGILEASDDLIRLRGRLGRLLSDLEAEVLELYVEGCTYQEIADRVGRHVKAVDNALQRIKRKLEQHLTVGR